jgi:IPT/TIG domain
MPTNSQNTYPITGQTVPADFLCVKDGQDVVNLVEQFCSVLGLGGGNGSSFPAQDTLAQQALALVQQLQIQLAALQAQTPIIQTSGAFQAMPAGATPNIYEVPITFTTPMPDGNYEVYISIMGASNTTEVAGAAFAWWVVNGSQTQNGFRIHFDNPPAASATWSYAWMAIEAPAPGSQAVSISGIAPIMGAAGTSVTIYGVGFNTVQSVTLGGSTCAIISTSATQVVVTTPAGLSNGNYNFVVTTASGQTSSPYSFEVIT